MHQAGNEIRKGHLEPCPHHVSEIVLEKVFLLHDSARSPKLVLFSHFRDFWSEIDQTKYRTFALQQLSKEYH